MGKREHILCYVETPWAYFTNVSLEKQWGDDWDDKPYQDNAGDPYEESPGGIIKLAFEIDDVKTPDSQGGRYSVGEINSKGIAWLWKRDAFYIPAGTKLSSFIYAIEGCGGKIYQARGKKWVK